MVEKEVMLSDTAVGSDSVKSTIVSTIQLPTPSTNSLTLKPLWAI